MRGTFTEAHIADLHFGAMDPVMQNQILEEQFINKIVNLPLDIISINGDLFDKKFLANSEVVTQVNYFISKLVNICMAKQCTLIVIHGTNSHDAHQLNILYHYQNMDNLDIRIIEKPSFQIVKGKVILCIPEERGMGAPYYRNILDSMDYDACYMHGTYVNSIRGKNISDLNSDKEPVFCMDDFWRCRGPIISGHVHVAHCYDKHFYYSGSPYRWCYGEEQAKGFFILLHDLDSGYYCNHFEEIKSFRYDTVDLDKLLMTDPNDIVKYIDNLKASGIEHLRIKIRKYSDVVPIIKDHYRNNNGIDIADVSRQSLSLQASEEVMDKYKDMPFLLDNNLNEYEKFVKYVNHYEGEQFITLDELMDLLKES